MTYSTEELRELKILNSLCISAVGINPRLHERAVIYGRDDFELGLKEMGIVILDTVSNNTKHEAPVMLGRDGTFWHQCKVMSQIPNVPLRWGESVNKIGEFREINKVAISMLYRFNKQNKLVFVEENAEKKYFRELLKYVLRKNCIRFRVRKPAPAVNPYWNELCYLGYEFNFPSIIPDSDGYYVVEFSHNTMTKHSFNVLNITNFNAFDGRCSVDVGLDLCLDERYRSMSGEEFTKGLKDMGVYIVFEIERIPSDAMIVFEYVTCSVWSKFKYNMTQVPLRWGERIPKSYNFPPLPSFEISSLKYYYEDNEINCVMTEPKKEFMYWLLIAFIREFPDLKDYSRYLTSRRSSIDSWNCLCYLGYKFDKSKVNKLLRYNKTYHVVVFA